jgi:uncharacterized protein YndB with AHSA1/START domain
VKVLVLIMLAFMAAALATIGVLGLVGAPFRAYYWPPLVIGVAGVAITLGLVGIWRDIRGLPILLADLIAVVAVALGAQHHALAGVITVALFTAWIFVWTPTSMRSRRITVETDIARDPQTVFDFASDIRNWSRYVRGVTSVKQLTEGPVGRGTRFDVTSRAGSVVFREIDEVVEYLAPSRFAWRSKADASSSAERLTFVPRGASTRVTHEVSSEESYPVALVGTALANPLLKWAGSRDRRENLAGLKRVLESNSGT